MPQETTKRTASCPHTMKATDKDGVTYCCDCGRVLKAINR